MLSIFLLQSRTNFSSMPNFRLAAELLELSDAHHFFNSSPLGIEIETFDREPFRSIVSTP